MKILQQAEELFWQGKFPEALKLLDQIEIDETVSQREQLQGQLLRCRIFAYQDVKKAQKLADQIIKINETLNQPLIQVDVCLAMAEAWLEPQIF